MARTPGIDVSRYQGTIDWARVAASGYRFAIIRATVGNYYTDPRFYENWRGARDAQMLVSAYHVVKPGHSAESQISRLLEVLEGYRCDLPLVLDVELADALPPAAVTGVVRECCERVTQQAGRRPILYTGRWFWEPNLQPSPEWADYDLWIAHYGVENPTLPSDWSDWKFWQYSETGSVVGVSSRHTDLNWFNGSYADLLAYAQKTDDGEKEDAGRLRGRVITPALRVRSGPGVQYDYLRDLHAGDVVDIQAIEGKEVWVSIGPGQWVALSFNGERHLVLE